MNEHMHACKSEIKSECVTHAILMKLNLVYSFPQFVDIGNFRRLSYLASHSILAGKFYGNNNFCI